MVSDQIENHKKIRLGQFSNSHETANSLCGQEMMNGNKTYHITCIQGR